MKRYIIGAMVWGIVGVVAYFAMPKPKTPAPTSPHQSETPVVAKTTKTPPISPVVLANVVDVADIDPLLDPPVRPAGGVPFDTEPLIIPISSSNVPNRIPLADEPAIEVAPMPREAHSGRFVGSVGYFF